MKIPRDLSGNDLIKLLKNQGYEITRQSGSHIRLTTQMKGEHHVTIPNHSPLKVGTLSDIVAGIAAHLNLSKEEMMKELFG